MKTNVYVNNRLATSRDLQTRLVLNADGVTVLAQR
jgi:hypothetical protein